jgi:polysaccharide export outer membrane protein
MRSKFFFAVLTLAVAAACAAQTVPQQTSAAAPQTSQQKPDDAQAPAAAKGTQENDPDYVIGIEDVIAVNVWHEPEMSRAMGVRPDGKISLPLIGEVVAEGKTPKQLQTELSKKLSDLIKNPDVTVIVQDIKSQKFNVLGEVQKPGVFQLTKPMTVLDAIAMAGGFRDFAKPKKMYILRRAKDGSNTKIPVNYNNVIKGNDKNVELESRDTIIVP